MFKQNVNKGVLQSKAQGNEAVMRCIRRGSVGVFSQAVPLHIYSPKLVFPKNRPDLVDDGGGGGF